MLSQTLDGGWIVVRIKGMGKAGASSVFPTVQPTMVILKMAVVVLPEC